jgi:hypothetical protein
MHACVQCNHAGCSSAHATSKPAEIAPYCCQCRFANRGVVMCACKPIPTAVHVRNPPRQACCVPGVLHCIIHHHHCGVFTGHGPSTEAVAPRKVPFLQAAILTSARHGHRDSTCVTTWQWSKHRSSFAREVPFLQAATGLAGSEHEQAYAPEQQAGGDKQQTSTEFS